MTDQEARYDRIADGYATWWAPVHRSATLRLLDAIDADVRAGARSVLDVGCGTGALAAAAVERWPDVVVDAVDASEGMLRVAERTLDRLPGPDRDRVQLRQAAADSLGIEDASVDLVVTSFVLQLVPSPYRALREARRVLRPGGRLAYLNWLRSETPFAADEAFEDALASLGLPGRDGASGSDDPGSTGVVVARLRRAGYVDAHAQRDVLVHQFTPRAFLEFLVRFDAEDLFGSLEPNERERLQDAVLRRLQDLTANDLRLELPIFYATARRRPGRS